MPQATAQLFLSLGGINCNGTFKRSAPGQISQQLTPDLFVAGKTGPLSTRTSDSVGIVTLGADHGFVNTDIISVCWAGGSRLRCTITAHDATTISIATGTGDNLPLATTDVVVSKVVNIDVDFDGDLVEMVGAVCDCDTAVGFYDAADALLMQMKLKGGDPQGEPWFWAKDSGVTNPLAGNPVAYVLVGNGETSAGTFNLAALYDSV
jgi:hypothetical protein